MSWWSGRTRRSLKQRAQEAQVNTNALRVSKKTLSKNERHKKLEAKAHIHKASAFTLLPYYLCLDRAKRTRKVTVLHRLVELDLDLLQTLHFSARVVPR